MGEREDNEVPKGGFWSYSYWLAFIPAGIVLGVVSFLKAGGKLPF